MAPITRCSASYRNEGGGVYVPDTLPAPAPGWLDLHAASWADYNSDGTIDLLVTGNFVGDGEIAGRSEIYENRGGAFAPTGGNGLVEAQIHLY